MSEKDLLQTDALPAAIVIPAVTDVDVSQKPKLTNISTSPNSLSRVAKARSYFVLPTSTQSIARSTSFFRIPKTSPTTNASPFSRQSDSVSETNSIKSVKSFKSTVSFKTDNVEKQTHHKSLSNIVVDAADDISEYGSEDIKSLQSEDFENDKDVFIVKDILTKPKKCRLKEVAGQRPSFRRVDSSDSIPPPNEHKHLHVHHDAEPFNSVGIDDNNDKVTATAEGKYFAEIVIS